ncbi:MAG: serine/threonine protein kinase [Planctomycetes bacterium]|nr:serine/threonine protein kinase [Planctomycetota bacterium]
MSGDPSKFRATALASGLVTEAQIEDAVSAIRHPPGGPSFPDVLVDDALLAAMLVEMGVLTAYQADQLRSGRKKLSLGPYIVTDWIAQGGMGQVFKAIHEMMGREVAIKVLPLNKSTPESIAKFNREIRTQAQLDHPNLVRAYDAGHDGNVYFLVTEYVAGADLRRLVRNEGKLTVQQAAHIMSQAAMGLEHAHERGLIHRDVKPGNVLVTPKGMAKVSDLGLSGWLDEGANDPRAGKVVGTPDYLSPEQIKNPAKITPASDIYSLGCTLYYAVTGKVPFPGGTAAEKARRHCEDTPWHPRRFTPDISEEFVEIIADMMEKDPKDRIPSAAEVVKRLEPWAGQSQALPTRRLNRSPWTPPPLPGSDDAVEVALDADTEGAPAKSDSSPSQISQTTDPVAGAGQDTTSIKSPTIPRPRRLSSPPPLPSQRGTQIGTVVAITLAISVPVSMAVGALLMFVLLSLLNAG